jgi:UDP-glucose 6-dehydrogenase
VPIIAAFLPGGRSITAENSRNCGAGYHLQLRSAAIEVNNLEKRRAIQKLKDELGALVGARVAQNGLTFKPGTDDMRDAPSAVLAVRLLAVGADLLGSYGAPSRSRAVDSTGRHITEATCAQSTWPRRIRPPPRRRGPGTTY